MQRIVNAEYYHANQACYLCLQPHDGIDTETQIVGEGVLFICRNCVATMAKTAGFDLDDRSVEIVRLKQALSDERKRADEAEARLVQLDEAAEHIRQRRESLEKARAAKAEKDSKGAFA